MSQSKLTRRDREHLISIFLLKGHEEPVGPSKLANKMNVSRAGALKKMRRLEKYGVGEYIPGEGLTVNGEGVAIIEDEILNHHAVENFFQKSLGMDFEDACKEAEILGSKMSKKMIDQINIYYGKKKEARCGLDLEPPFEPEDIEECPWCKRLFD